MKVICQISFLLINFSCFTSKAQNVTISVLQQGTSYQDSSYYDIMPVADKFWIGGKYGTLKMIDKDGNLENINSPSQHLDIYKLDKFDEQNLIACGDKGRVYLHNTKQNLWKTIKVKGYEKACFYNMVVVDENTAYICGGNSKIAHSKKRIPNGFILESKDKGLTWKKVYSNPFMMVWCVKYNAFAKKVYALMYTPNRTYLYGLEGNNWKKEKNIGNSIFHEIQFLNAQDYVATGGWQTQKGRIYSNNKKAIFPNSGLIWGRTEGSKYDIYSASKGQILFDDKMGNYHCYAAKLNKDFNIYETVFTSDSTAIAIGSARTILMIKIEENTSDNIRQQVP